MQARRSCQLDALYLDGEVQALLRPLWMSVFTRAKGPDFVAHHAAELGTALQGFLHAASRLAGNASYGDRLLNLTYHDAWAPAPVQSSHNDDSAGSPPRFLPPPHRKPSAVRQALCGLSLIALEYLLARLAHTAAPFEEDAAPGTLGRRWKRAARWVQRAEPYVRLLGLLHFLAFLVYGRYRSLWDRLFGLRLVPAGPRTARAVNFELLDRQVAAKAVAEFLAFASPLLQRCVPWAWRSLLEGSPGATPTPGAEGDHCCVCGQTMDLPYEAGCRHLFCYFCARARQQAMPHFACPRCGKTLTDLRRRP